jgi:hypothetical protein
LYTRLWAALGLPELLEGAIRASSSISILIVAGSPATFPPLGAVSRHRAANFDALKQNHKERESIMKRSTRKLMLVVLSTGFMFWIGLAFPQEAGEKRDQTKFGKYVVTKQLYKKIDHYTGTSIVSHNGELQDNVSFCYHCLAKPITFDKPHTHNFREILCFIGGNPLDITDFSAEVEYTIGDEKHVLREPGCVTMPPGQQHCPIAVKNVSTQKPIVFIEISLTNQYGQAAPKKQ